MAAVDLGAQSGLVRNRAVRRRAARAGGAHRFPNIPVARTGHAPLGTSCASTPRTCSMACKGAARIDAIDSVSVTAWAVDFGLIDRAVTARSDLTPSHYRDSRRAARPSSRCLARVAGARAVRAHGHPAARDQHDRFELAGMRAESDVALEAADGLLMIPPTSLHFWLCGMPHSGVHQTRRRPSAPRCRDGRLGGSTCFDRLEIPHRLPCPRSSPPPPRTALGTVRPRRSRGDGTRRRRRRRGRDPTTPARAVAGVPFSGPDAVLPECRHPCRRRLLESERAYITD